MSPVEEPLPEDAGSRLGLRPGLKKPMANIAWLVLDRVLGLAMGMTIAVLLARHLRTARFSLLSYALSFVALFGFLASLGLQGIVVREIVRAPARRDEILGSAFVLQLVGGSPLRLRRRP